MSENVDFNLNIPEMLITEVRESWNPQNPQLPTQVIDKLILNPSYLIDAIYYFDTLREEDDQQGLEILTCIILEGLSQIRYGLDRGDNDSQRLLEKTQRLIKEIYPNVSNNKKMLLANMLHDSKLPIHFSVDEGNSSTMPDGDNSIPNITPRLPELLEQLRTEHGFTDPYELYDLLISQMQLQPVETQLILIHELVLTKKTIPHEVATLMLLHPNEAVRQKILTLFLNVAPEDAFSPIDLRRMLCIRNWLPRTNQHALDKLIKDIKSNGVTPAHYAPSQVTKLVASTVDGAGVQLIMLEAKFKNKRQMGGFLLKLGVGIREPYIHKKVAKGEFEVNLEKNFSLPYKAITQAYVTKLVGHFLSIGQKHGNVPEPYFLQICELCGARNWQPQPLNITDEINRIKEKACFSTAHQELVANSLKRSGSWHMNEKFTDSWFEAGESSESAFNQSLDKHNALLESESSADTKLEDVATEAIISPMLDKWKQIFLVMLLWHRTKSIKGSYWKDFLVTLELLESGKRIAEIPLMKNIAAKSGAHVIRSNIRRGTNDVF